MLTWAFVSRTSKTVNDWVVRTDTIYIHTTELPTHGGEEIMRMVLFKGDIASFAYSPDHFEDPCGAFKDFGKIYHDICK